MQTSNQRGAKAYAHPKYRRQTRSFIFWMILSFVSTIACSVMLGKALHSRDLLDMTRSGWMLIPKEGSDPTEALIRGECVPGDASCGTWSRIGKLNFSKNPEAVKVRRLFLVADHDFGSVLAAREGKETLVNRVASMAGQAYSQTDPGLVVNFDEAYGEYQGWLDGHFLGLTSRQMDPETKIYPFSFSEALPMSRGSLEAGRSQRLVVKVDTFRDYDQTVLWRAVSFAIRYQHDHIAAEFLTAILLAGGLTILLAMGAYHGLMWLRRREPVLMGVTVFMGTLGIQNFFYYNISVYFGIPANITNIMRVSTGYWQPLTYIAFALFMGIPISRLWQEFERRRGRATDAVPFSAMTRTGKFVSVVGEVWCLIVLPILVLSPFFIPINTALAIIYKVGLPINVLVMFMMFGVQLRYFIRESRVRNISYAIPFAASLSVFIATMIAGIVGSLGVSAFPSLTLCMGATVSVFLVALAVGNQFTQLYREVVNTRQRLRNLVSKGREVSSLVSLEGVVNRLSSAMKAVSDPGLKIKSFFSASCFGEGTAPSGFYELDSHGQVRTDSRVELDSILESYGHCVQAKDPRSLETLAVVAVEHEDSLVLERNFAACEALANNLASAITTVRLEQTFGKLERRTREIRTIFSNINQGICMFDGNLQVGSEHSAALETMLGAHNVTGRDILDLLFVGSSVSGDQLETVRTVLTESIGEDALAFETNSASLPREIEIDRHGNRLFLELDWTPIVDTEDVVQQIMLTLRDVSAIRKLRAEAEQNQRQLEILQQLVAVPVDSYYRFTSTAHEYLDASNSCLAESPVGESQIKNIKRHLHTIKGNSRTLKFHILTTAIHEAENEFLAVTREQTWLSSETVARCGELVGEVRKVLAAYEEVNDIKLRRDKHEDKKRASAIQSLTGLVRETLAERAARGQSDPEHETAFVDLVRMVFPTFGGLLRTQRDGLDRLAQQVGVATPRLRILLERDLVLHGEYADTIHGVFGHLIGNSLDHGFSCMGNQRVGTIVVECALTDTGLHVVFRDDGAGLDLGTLLAKGVERGLLTETATDEQIAEVVFESGLSTASKVTAISGRGVGLDAARKLVGRVGGALHMRLLTEHDETGHCQFEMHMHLPTHAVLFDVPPHPDFVHVVAAAA